MATHTPMTVTLGRATRLTGLLTFGLECTLIPIGMSTYPRRLTQDILRTAGCTRVMLNEMAYHHRTLDIDSPAVKIININHRMPKRNNLAGKGAKYNMYTQEQRDQTVRYSIR